MSLLCQQQDKIIHSLMVIIGLCLSYSVLSPFLPSPLLAEMVALHRLISSLNVKISIIATDAEKY